MARGRKADRSGDAPEREGDEGGGDGGGVQHNSAARAYLIRKAAGGIRSLESRRDALREEVKGFNKQISDIFRGMKTDLAMNRGDAEFALRLLALESEDRNSTLDTLKEMVEALLPGETVDWVKAGQRANERQAAGDTGTGDVGTGFTAAVGEEAGYGGKPASENPWPEGSASNGIWQAGWVRGQAKRAEEVGPGGSAPAPTGKERRPRGGAKQEQPALV